MLAHMGAGLSAAAIFVYCLGVLKECLDDSADYGDLAADLVGIFAWIAVWGWAYA